MKKLGLAVVALCGVLAVAVWMHWPEPAGEQVWAYQTLHEVDYRLLRGDALGFVTAKTQEGFELHTRYSEATYFEIRCKGVRVMVVENASSRVLIRIPTDALRRAPDIARLHANVPRWLDHDQSHDLLLVSPDEPSWFLTVLRRLFERVPRKDRCVLGGDRGGDRWPSKLDTTVFQRGTKDYLDSPNATV
ncbi:MULTISPECIES: cold-shock protein [Stenotrophomonas]|uniref:Cold-shock protein n=1 Tax=Stenotrophomonas lactitubi TaxID=2045214 RepID=A0AAW4GDR9_9GAMM|nr:MULTISPECIES: cold-shock protein [Stenotrophomonas]MBM9912913.1 cold-shock protein [Stenotrophomonas lactitubi]MBM9922534.1 cold-shock protein [Stenotrophomonas lactitubi]MBM9937559.1 cold-shock protein [Stenotrophomonas lactitubi]